MKRILVFLFFIVSLYANAGIYDSRYFEPSVGCAVAGGFSYLTTKDDASKMKNAAISCLGVGAVLLLVNMHYENKYYDKSSTQDTIRSLRERLQRFEMLEYQQKNGVEEDSDFIYSIEVFEPSINANGEGVGRRLKEKLIMIDHKDFVGE